MGLSVPGLVMVTMKSKHSTNSSLGLEDHAAVAASIQNFMLSLHADGVASKWMTGAMKIPADAILDMIGANGKEERFVGAIWFGYAIDADITPPKRKLGVAGILTDLP